MTHRQPTTPISPILLAERLDLELLAKVGRHAELWLQAADDDVAPGVTDEMCLLECEIAATPVNTQTALAAKLRVIDRADFCPAVMEVVRQILKQDRKRVGR